MYDLLSLIEKLSGLSPENIAMLCLSFLMLWSIYKAQKKYIEKKIPLKIAVGVWCVTFICYLCFYIFDKVSLTLTPLIFLTLLYVAFFTWSLITLKPHYKVLANIQVETLLFLSILFAFIFVNDPKITIWALLVVLSYLVLSIYLMSVGDNTKKGMAGVTHTLKKGYLLRIEEVDKEISLFIVALVTIAFSLGSVLVESNEDNNKESISVATSNLSIEIDTLKNIVTFLDEISNIKGLEPMLDEHKGVVKLEGIKAPSYAYKEVFSYQVIVLILTLLMLIFSYIKFSLKRDELTKKEDKTIKLASRGRYGENYGCSNKLLWKSRRVNIEKELKKNSDKEMLAALNKLKDEEIEKILAALNKLKDEEIKEILVALNKLKDEEIKEILVALNKLKYEEIEKVEFFTLELTKLVGLDTDKKLFIRKNNTSWDHLCQYASAYYSHAIDLNKHDDLDELETRSNESKSLDFKNYKEFLEKASSIYEELKTYKNSKEDDNLSNEYYHYIDVLSDIENLAFHEKTPIKLASNLSVNHEFNLILRRLKCDKCCEEPLKDVKYEEAEEGLKKIIQGVDFEDKYQKSVAKCHKKTIDLLNALKNANKPEKLKEWIETLKYATGHIKKNKLKFEHRRIDGPVNLFITTIGTFFVIIGLIVLLEIFEYSKVANVEIFALSGSAIGLMFAFVFKTTIESFFASLQMYLSDMLRLGDRIKCEALGIDGHVSGFDFSSIEFRNLNNSYVKVPAKELIHQTFSNLKSLPDSGRQIEIKLVFTNHSIKRISLFKKYENISDMGSYFDCKFDSLATFNNTSTLTGNKSCKNNEDKDKEVTPSKSELHEKEVGKGNYPQKRFLTNLGSFRAYAEQYLFEHQWLNDNQLPMVVVSNTNDEGVEVLFSAYSQPDDRFVRTKAFLSLQSDILEHLIVTSKYFDLDIFQAEGTQAIDEEENTGKCKKK
jgi:small-conductance mechanosensitive channel